MGAGWREAVIYQVHVRSFADGDGDGVGDLIGVRDRLPHLSGLGVDAIWLTRYSHLSAGSVAAPAAWGAVRPRSQAARHPLRQPRGPGAAQRGGPAAPDSTDRWKVKWQP
jgi:hypothetical protein